MKADVDTVLHTESHDIDEETVEMRLPLPKWMTQNVEFIQVQVVNNRGENARFTLEPVAERSKESLEGDKGLN